METTMKKEMEIHFSPQVVKAMEGDPKCAEYIRDLAAKFRQAGQYVDEGRYPTLEAAMEALTGGTCSRIDEDELDAN